MKRAIFLVLASVIEALSFSQNLVQNPMFDTWSTSGRPAKWTNAAGCLKDSAKVRSASYSCRQITTSTSKDLGQKIPVEAGKKYSFSFFYNTDTTKIGNGCRVYSDWLNDTLGIIEDTESRAVLHSSYMKSDTWSQFIVDVTAPEGAITFYLLVRTMSRSVTYWDDFIFREYIVSDNPETRFADMTLYPNPACDYLIINTLHNIQHIDIQDFTGRVVWSSDFSGEIPVTIPVSALREGMYIARIRTPDKIMTRKFIKNIN